MTLRIDLGARFNPSQQLDLARMEDYFYQGFLPCIYDHQQRLTTAWSNYYQTYVERDVRQPRVQ
ncbi:MAG: hypothetical protein WDZ76_01605 [Pseudohongiellaceae bacterium]